MGNIVISEEQLLRIIGRFKREWQGNTYDILRRNCCAFSNELCKELGVGPIPDWIINLSTVGADLRSMVRRPLRQMEAAMSPDPVVPAEPKRDLLKTSWSPQPNRAAYEPLAPVLRTGDDNIKVSIPLKGLWKCLASSLVLAMLCVVCCVLVIFRERIHVPLLGSGIPSSQKNGVPGPTTAPFNCSKDYFTWQLDWSVRKQQWCCAHMGYACPPKEKHDCQATQAQVEVWSEDKRIYCCKHENYGCFSTHDCVGSQLLWDTMKREWCCKHRDVGCPTPHNCTAANASDVTGWSSSKLEWCCEHENTGCMTNNSEPDAGHRLTHLHSKMSGKRSEHDCWAANASEIALWPREKQIWCCKHRDFGCSAGSNTSDPDAILIVEADHASFPKTSPDSDADQDAAASVLPHFETIPPSASHSANSSSKNGRNRNSSSSSSNRTAHGSNSAAPRINSSSHHKVPSHEPSSSSSSSSSTSSGIVHRESSTSKHVRSDVGTATTGSPRSMLHSSKNANSSRTADANSSDTSSSSSAHHVSARQLRAADEKYLHTQPLGEPASLPKQVVTSHFLRGLPVDNSVQMQ